jgi:ABC-type transport system substrate-binding protein
VALDRARTTNLADIFLEEGDAGGLLASRFLLDRPPFDDDRVRRAIHLAIDRRALAALLYPPMDNRPSARLTGPIAPVMERWALLEDDLLKRPGYAEDRAQAIAEAKQLWAAALGDAPISELRVLFAGVPRTIPEIAVAAVQRQLSEALGVTVVPRIDPSGDALIAAGLRLNVEGAAEGTAALTFGFEDGGVDLDDWVYGQFRSGAPANTFRLQDATLDALLDKQRAEFDEDARHTLGLDIQDYLLANVNARLEYLAPVNRRLSWGYVRNPHFPIWYGSDYMLADTWLDTSHPAWADRRTV